MRFDKLKKQLELILLLTEGKDYTIDDLCQKMEISRRNVYYLIEFLKHSGFIFFKTNRCYHIDRRSPFMSQLFRYIQLSDREVKEIYSLLAIASPYNQTLNQLRDRLERAYSIDTISYAPLQKQIRNNFNTINQAINEQKMVKIVGYSSPHSHTVKDRIVEPYYIMNNHSDVRCYELTSKQNKTFKLSRMASVEPIDAPWIHKDLHKEIFTDIFMFSSEEKHPVKLRLGQLAYNVFTEEHPEGSIFIRQEDEDHWILSIDVCDYRGIGRFILGLPQDIEIIADDGLREHIIKEIKWMGEKFSNQIKDQ